MDFFFVNICLSWVNFFFAIFVQLIWTDDALCWSLGLLDVYTFWRPEPHVQVEDSHRWIMCVSWHLVDPLVRPWCQNTSVIFLSLTWPHHDKVFVLLLYTSKSISYKLHWIPGDFYIFFYMIFSSNILRPHMLELKPEDKLWISHSFHKRTQIPHVLWSGRIINVTSDQTKLFV